jgi:hypothetical protein
MPSGEDARKAGDGGARSGIEQGGADLGEPRGLGDGDPAELHQRAVRGRAKLHPRVVQEPVLDCGIGCGLGDGCLLGCDGGADHRFGHGDEEGLFGTEMGIDRLLRDTRQSGHRVHRGLFVTG